MPTPAPAFSPPAVLAQLNLGDLINPAIPPLDPPPAHEAVLFESPWLAVAVLAAVGALALFGLARAGKLKLGGLGLLACLALAAGLIATSRLVTTERERVAARAAELIAATAQADTDRLATMLHPQVRVRTGLVGIPLGADALLAQVDLFLGTTYPIESHGVRDVQAQIDGPESARTIVSVTADPASGGPVGSWWAMQWRKDAALGWRLIDLELLHMPRAGVIYDER